MKKILIFAPFLLLFVSLVSAEILITQQPNAIYSYGDFVSVPAIVKTASAVSGTSEMDIICNGLETNFYKNGIQIAAGEEKQFDAGVSLTTKIAGSSPATCTIKIMLNTDYVTTNEFRVSDLISVELLENQSEFVPEQEIIIEGRATKANGNPADGFVELSFLSENVTQNLTYKNTISNGFFSIKFSMPKETRFGDYVLRVNAYEKDVLDFITNRGSSDTKIHVNQVPTSLEMIFQNNEIEPGTSMRVKTILHDQTGEKILSNAIISVKDSNNQIRDQTEKQTDDFFEVPTAYNEPPGKWSVVAVSEGITSESTFKIRGREASEIKIVNNTLIITNVGNVPYNESLLVKIGGESVNLLVSLSVDETRKFVLNAPDGEYDVEIINGGKQQAAESVTLTGKVISVKEASAILTLTRYPLAWIFVILVLGFVLAMVLRKGYQRSFVGYMSAPKKEKPADSKDSLNLSLLRKGMTLKSRNKAELSLSLKGDKQGVSLTLLRIKNSEDIKGSEACQQVLQQVINFAEENKSIAYISDGYKNILFISAPIMTKTFKNEKAAVEIARNASEVISKYNKLAKHKIDFGISVNYGDMVLNKEGSILKFMNFGNSLTVSKKVASLSNGEVLISEDFKNKVSSEMTVERQPREDINIYTVKEARFKGDTSKFIDSFKKRMEK